jgi:hypothetical protein
MHKNLSPARLLAGAFAVACMVVVFAGPASASPRHSAFVVSARNISGAPTGAVNLIGIGVTDNSNGSFRSGGAFRCTATVNQGPLTGCLAGQGTRYDSSTLLASAPFKCTGAPGEALKTATTDGDTAAFTASFFRYGDGGQPSFTANVIVAGHDIAPDIAGVQNVWVQGVGCAYAGTHFIG